MSGGDDERFVREHEGLVTSIAKRLRIEMDLSTPAEDLRAWGFQGLLEARSRFDASRGVQFSTFAYYRVRGAMLDGVRKMGYVSRRAHEMAKLAEAADAIGEEAAEKAAGRGEAQARDTEATVAAIDDILTRTTAAFVLEAVGQSENVPVARPDEMLIAAESHARVRAAVEALPEREAKVLRDFYFKSRALDDIGADLKLSRSRVSRIHTHALKLVREAMEKSE
jgi:RNA polymerase sigma factor for flagellar operon FliA